MSVGIGITTRNRPECLEAALRHFGEFGHGDKLVIIDDNSDVEEVNRAVVASSSVNALYKYSNKRLGISKAKNACLYELSECDHVFIFDDDAWPNSYGWESKWIDINQANGVGHSLYSVDCEASPEVNQAMRAHINISERFGTGDNQMLGITNCFGVMLYFTRECLNSVGGYDTSTENVYGYEHAQISIRASKAGFTRGHSYISPIMSTELIYSIDIAHNWLGQKPKLSVKWLDRFRSSVTKDEAEGHTKNAQIMSSELIFIPVINPITEEQ